MENNINECPHCRKKVRDEKEHKELLNRLSRIEGQIRGIKKMVDDDCYCTDIIVQVSAAAAALNSFNKELLSRHIKTCVSEDIKAGEEETVDELCALIAKLMK
ncbi:MAG: metal-sensing transcriptional repressor [Clostridia bacterium]|nr:metal-sensing transcriptional repressor [Clostridia bacterium]